MFLTLIERHIFHWLRIFKQPFVVPFALCISRVQPQLGFSEWAGTWGFLLLTVFLSSLALTAYAKLQGFSCQMLTEHNKREIEGLFYLSWKLREIKINKAAFCLECPLQWARQDEYTEGSQKPHLLLDQHCCFAALLQGSIQLYWRRVNSLCTSKSSDVLKSWSLDTSSPSPFYIGFWCLEY